MQLSQLFVLVIEPSRVQRHIIERELQNLGIEHIESFSEGRAALDFMQNTTPDIVLSSMHLPDMTGTEVVTNMRQQENLRDITFLLVSSETHYRYLEPIRQAGAIAILPKPFCSSELKTALQSTLHYIHDTDSEHEEDDFEGLSVLVVDDSLMSRRFLVQMLESLGIGYILEAKDGAEGLMIMKQNTFDLIITDYNMPNVDGLEFVEHIRNYSEQPTVPVMMVTSEQNENRLAAVQSAGVSALCNKPFSYENAKQLIQQLVVVDR